MFNGTVSFAASINGDGITFDSFEFDPNVQGVDKVTIEAPSNAGDRIRAVVDLAGVASEEYGRKIALEAMSDALNRIAFDHDLAIETSRCTGEQFSPVGTTGGVVAGIASLCIGGDSAHIVKGITDLSSFKAKLEQSGPPGQRYFGMYRTALDSTGPTETFMCLYNILLTIFDFQQNVDDFIVAEEPNLGIKSEPLTQEPRCNSQIMETVYRRLRNEIAHRPANLNKTKSEMAIQVGNLAMLTKRAIELIT